MSTYGTPEPVVSGQDYEVTEVDGHPPTDVADFVGEVTVTLRGRTGDHVVRGQGAVSGDEVRVHEKSDQGHGKDVRTWTVSRAGDTFVASAG